MRDGKGNFSVNNQNLLKYHTNGSRNISSIKIKGFNLVCLMSNKMDPLRSFLDVKIHMIKKSVSDAGKLYVLRGNKSACVFCSLSSALFFIGDNIFADHFKEEITPSLKANNRLTFSQDVAFNHVSEKGKPQCKLSYKVLKEEYGKTT